MEDPGCNLISHIFHVNSLIGCAYETRMDGSLCRHVAPGGAPCPLSKSQIPARLLPACSCCRCWQAELTSHLRDGHHRSESETCLGKMARLLHRSAGEDAQGRWLLPLDTITGRGALLQNQPVAGEQPRGLQQRVFS